MLYAETGDRKVLKARETQVVEVRAVPHFYVRLSDGTTFEFDGTVLHSFGVNVEAVKRRTPLDALSARDLGALVCERPLSWVVFNSGSHRIVFSNAWFLTLKPGPDETWRLDLGDGRRFAHPPQ